MLTHIKDSKNCWTVVINNRSYQFDPTHQEYVALVECVKVGDSEEFVSLFDTKDTIINWSEGEFMIEKGQLWYKEYQVHDVITKRVIEMIRTGFDYKPVLKFLENLYNNPSYRAINELYTFLTHKFLPITSDGHFLAYKAVRSDFKDKYSGKFDNSVGQVVTMPRFGVDDNCSVGCSNGLHVGAIDYVKSYGGPGDKVVVCKVNPADVVSVPLDSEHQKVRCCRYEVVAEYNGNLLPAVVDEYDEELDDYDDDEMTQQWQSEFENWRGVEAKDFDDDYPMSTDGTDWV